MTRRKYSVYYNHDFDRRRYIVKYLVKVTLDTETASAAIRDGSLMEKA